MHPTAARLLHAAAGHPEPAGKPLVTTDAPCWWCHQPCGRGTDAEAMIPQTFPQIDRRPPRQGRFVCEACAWTLASAPRFPAWFASEKLARYARDGRRCIVYHEGEPTTQLLLTLEDGTVGRWSIARKSGDEKVWSDARDSLRTEPRDIGPCTYLGSVPLAELEAGPERFFFSYHHLGAIHADGSVEWIPTTDSRKDVLRSWVLSPPDCPHVIAIGTGKKHCLIFCEVSAPGAHVLHFQGDTTNYHPARLARLIEDIEALLLAGFSAEEIERGDYAPRDPAALMTLTAHEQRVRPYRGSPLLSVALYLRRPLEDLRDDHPAPLIQPRWTARHMAGLEPYTSILPEIPDDEQAEPVDAGAERRPDPAPVPPMAESPAPAPEPDPPRQPPGQLSLFG